MPPLSDSIRRASAQTVFHHYRIEDAIAGGRKKEEPVPSRRFKTKLRLVQCDEPTRSNTLSRWKGVGSIDASLFLHRVVLDRNAVGAVIEDLQPKDRIGGGRSFVESQSWI